VDDRKVLDLYLSLYQQELAHRDSINARVQFAAGLFILVLGGVFYYTRNWPSFDTLVLALWFWTTFGLGVAALTVAGVLIVRSHWSLNATYAYAPDLRNVDTHRKRLMADREKFGRHALDPDTEFPAFIVDSLAEAGGHNRSVNVCKSGRLYWGGLLVVISAVLLAIAAVPYRLNTAN
jgi:hypothetical protein